jgi:hypothetical protein
MSLPVDIKSEEAELYATCSRQAAAVYKFFTMIQVEFPEDKKTATIRFGKSYEDDEVDPVLAKQIRSYLKDQRKAVHANPKEYSAEEGRQKIFWLITMFIEHGIFSPSQQSKIMTYGSFVFHETRENTEDDE